jgi:hypothetical protein
LSVAVTALLEWAADGALGLLLLALCAIALTLLSHRTLIWAVGFFRNSVGVRAKKLFYAGSLNFLGFNFQTCMASVLFATTLYVLLKIAFRFPEIFHIWAGVIATTIIGFSVAGYWIGGKLEPLNFIKYFYIPAAAGVVFFILNVVFDLVLNVTGAFITYAAS